MRNDFLDHFCEPGYRKKNRVANPYVKSFRTNKPKVRDLIQDDDGEYEIFDERKHKKFSKIAKISRGQNHWNDQKDVVNRYRMIETFFQSRIGHFWNDIYSEICFATKKGDRHLIRRLRTGLVDFVQRNTFFGDDGEIYNDSEYSYCGPDLVRTKTWCNFYVHPETNKLHSTKQDFDKTIPRTPEQNRIFNSRRMKQHKIRKRNDKKRLHRSSSLIPFEVAMNDLLLHNQKNRNSQNG